MMGSFTSIYDTDEHQFIKRPLIILDLFSALGGTGWVDSGWSCAARRRGHTVITLEIESMFSPDINEDILLVSVEEIIEACGGYAPDIVLASPPCEAFSVARIWDNWDNWNVERKKLAQPYIEAREQTPDHLAPKPRNARTEHGRQLMLKTIELIMALKQENPAMYWWMENPRGMMRYQIELSTMRRETIHHASYHNPAANAFGFLGDEDNRRPDDPLPSLKPTDLWCDAPDQWRPRPMLKMSDGGTLYQKAPRGAKAGIQGMSSMPHPHGGPLITAYFVRSLIPFYLGWDVIVACEKALKVEAPINYRTHNQHDPSLGLAQRFDPSP